MPYFRTFEGRYYKREILQIFLLIVATTIAKGTAERVLRWPVSSIEIPHDAAIPT